MLDESHPEPDRDDRESVEVMQEARALDKAMEDRIVARKSSESSITSSSGIDRGSAWRSRYSHRKRTTSMTSSTTSGSVISEDLVEEEEEPDLLGIGGGFDDHSIRHKSSSERDTSSSSINSPESPTEEQPVFVHPIPPKKPPARSFLPRLVARQTPSTPASNPAFNHPSTSVITTKTNSTSPSRIPSKLHAKRRPTPLGITPTSSLSSEITIAATPVAAALSLRARTESRNPTTPSQPRKDLPKTPATATMRSNVVPASTPSQTLFVFPPSPTLTNRTPSAMTLTSQVNVSIPAVRTPRVSTFRTHGRTKSFIGIGSLPVATTACSRVDARGWVGIDTISAN